MYAHACTHVRWPRPVHLVTPFYMATLPEITNAELSRYDREWMKSVGKRRLSAIERALSDPELVSLRCELVKIDMRIADLDERSKDGESRAGWRKLNALLLTLLDKINTAAIPDEASEKAIRDTQREMASIVSGALDEFSHWEELKDLIERRRRLAATEQNWEKLQKVLIPASRLTLFFDNFHEAIYAVINDEHVRLQLLNELRVRLNGDSRKYKQAVPIELPPAYVPTPLALMAVSRDATVEELDDLAEVDEPEEVLRKTSGADHELSQTDGEPPPTDRAE